MSLDRAALCAIRRRRRKLILNALEIMLGDLVTMDGIPATKALLEVGDE